MPTKNNMFLTYDSDSIEIVKCYENEKKNFKVFDHPFTSFIKCHDYKRMSLNGDVGDNPQETALIALGYKNGKISIYHADELEQDITNP